MALEGMESDTGEELPLPNPDMLVENELTELQTSTNSGRALQAAQDEAVDVQGTLDGMSEHMQKSADEGEGMSAPVAQALNTAVEHLKIRVGFKGRAKFTAMEHLDAPARRQATRQAVAQHRAVSATLGRALVISQEGILDNLKDRFTLLFTSEDKLLKRLDEAAGAYDKGTLKTEPISGAGWGRHLSSNTKDTVSGKDVLSELKRLDDLIGSDELGESVRGMSMCVLGLEAAVQKSNLYSSKKEIDRIESEHKDIETLYVRVEKQIGGEGKGGNKSSFEPLSKVDKTTLVSLLKKMLSSGKLQKDCDQLKANLKGLAKAVAVNHEIRLAGFAAEDLRKALAASRAAQNALSVVSDLISTRVKVCHAAISYLAASTTGS